MLIGTAVIGFAPFHHCILGTTEVLAAMALGSPVSLDGFVGFLPPTTASNVVGGAVFVGLLNDGQVALADERQEVEFDAVDRGEWVR